MSLLGGCAYIHSLDENLPQQVKVWMDNKEYAKVIDTLAYIRPGHPQYKQLSSIRQIALEKAQEYETYILNRGSQLIDKELWHQAYLTYQQGLQKLPDSAAIQQAFEEFEIQRDAYIRQRNYQILFNKGQALLANTPIREEITKAAPEQYRYRTQARRHDEEKHDVALELLECAEFSLENNQLVTCEKCLELAAHLYDSPLPKRYHELLARLTKQQAAQQQVLSKAAQTNLAAATQAIKDKKLKQAMAHLQQVPVEDQQKPAVIKLKQELRKEIKLAVKQGAAVGRQLYSAGKIKEALAVWQSLLVLEPDNAALRKHADRAQRVLKKLETLEKKPANSKPQ
jgi:hypothetical protein